MFKRLQGMFTNDIAIDLGTANTLVYIKGKGIVLNQPSVVALDKSTGKVYAVGAEAKAMLGKTPDSIAAIRPMKDGVIADFEVTEYMLREFIKMAQKKRHFIAPRIVICVPSGITEVEKRAVRDSAKHAGAREVFLVAEPMAAAIGVGLPVDQPSGNMIIDIGGGTTEIAVIALNGIVCDTSIRVGGDEMDEAIVSYIKKNHNLLIGDQTAENIKKTIGSAHKFDEEREMEVKGLYQVSGVPKTLKISSRGDPRGPAGADPADLRRAEAVAGADAAGTGGRHQGPRHRADRRRRAAEGPARAAARADRPAHQPHGRPPVLRGAGHRQDPRRLRALPAGDHEGRAVLIPWLCARRTCPWTAKPSSWRVCIVLSVTLLSCPGTPACWWPTAWARC